MVAVLNFTTKVPVTRTLGEVSDKLAEHGADAIATTYTDRRPSGVQFALDGHTYALPVDVEAVERLLRKMDPKQLRASKVTPDRPQAERVAWRIVKDWLEAQLSLVAAQQVPLDEVMLPYLVTATGRALREEWRDHPLAITGGSRG